MDRRSFIGSVIGAGTGLSIFPGAMSASVPIIPELQEETGTQYIDFFTTIRNSEYWKYKILLEEQLSEYLMTKSDMRLLADVIIKNQHATVLCRNNMTWHIVSNNEDSPRVDILNDGEDIILPSIKFSYKGPLKGVIQEDIKSIGDYFVEKELNIFRVFSKIINPLQQVVVSIRTEPWISDKSIVTDDDLRLRQRNEVVCYTEACYAAACY